MSARSKAASGGARVQSKKWIAWSAVAVGIAYLLPNLLGFLIFTAGPVIFSFGASLTNWNIQNSPPLEFVGLRNYSDIVQNAQFWTFMVNTIYFMLFIPLGIAGSLGVALLLDSRLKGMVAFRTLLYLPSFTAGVAIMILWMALLNPDYGLINQGIEAFFRLLGVALQGPQWLLSTQNLLGLDPERLALEGRHFGLGAREGLVLMGFWTGLCGGNMLLYLAALSNMPEELIEASHLDGAGPWAVFRHVKWPQLAPTTFFIVIMSVIGGFQGGVDQAQVMTGGGPAQTTTTLSYYIFRESFTEYQFGYASAVAWILFVIIFGISALLWKFGNQETSY
jgi:multiple sugar transport system permease protein